VRYEQTGPSTATQGFVDCYRYLETGLPAEDAVQRVVPDGRPELILNLGKPFESASEARWIPQPAFFFAGQISSPMLLRPRGRAKMIGVRFRPEGASRIFRCPMHELAGLVVPLDGLSPRLDRELQPLRGMDSIASQWLFIDRALSRAARNAARNATHNSDAALAFALDTAIETAGLISVSGLAKRVNLSNRQLERRFLDAVGMTPKRFCRIRRFQRVLQAMEEPGANWADAAVACGYYDQAHLIRDFRRFSGLTPACLPSSDTDLAAHFVQSYAPSHFSNTERLDFG
jgi:AraC-like DNA-binding protein